MPLFRVIVVVAGVRTVQAMIPFHHAPSPGETIALADGRVVTVRHVIEARRDGAAGIVLAWDS
jgi:hypothetical protein